MIVVGAVLIVGGIAAIAASVPQWQDGLDDGMASPNTRMTGHDGWALGAAAGLDLLGLAGVTVGAVLLPLGIKKTAVEAQPASPLQAQLPTRARGVEVSFAF
jgi:hypothetical protein